MTQLSADVLRRLKSTSIKERREKGNGGPARTAFLAAMRDAWDELFPGQGLSAGNFRGDEWNLLVKTLDVTAPKWRGYEVGSALPQERQRHHHRRAG